ncbi:hypothetical protein NDU88_012460 [Pleurodeles waltl]|uniref:Uncharacterized protein n=1 Tax=Pleurodeles waltl TaxID=8319 RepID=A0AAV7R4P2_PLEWA|nr:hypothetical protein NDU88_012460 [Pleurodeles waltl]
MQARPHRASQDSAWFPQSASGLGRCQGGRPNRGARPQAQQPPTTGPAALRSSGLSRRRDPPAVPGAAPPLLRPRPDTVRHLAAGALFTRRLDCSARLHTGGNPRSLWVLVVL